MDDTRRLARDQGYVETVFGRRLQLPDIRAASGPRRQGAERAAINAPMQGTAADLIKMAMVAVQDWLDAERLRTRMIMQVHDELVLEVARRGTGGGRRSAAAADVRRGHAARAAGGRGGHGARTGNRRTDAA